MMASRVPFTILAGCAITFIMTAAQETCYTTNTDHYFDMASKTAYQNVYNKKGIPPIPGCKAVQLWLLNRHGTRYPSKSNIKVLTKLTKLRDQILSNYYDNKTAICQKDIDNLRSWQFNVTEDQGNNLTDQGREDLYQLGRRLATYFPEVFITSYSPNKFVFRHSNTTRTQESAQYFAKGVFGADFNTTFPYSDQDDELLQPYLGCRAWHKKTENKVQQQIFDQTEFMTQLVSSVSRRLGFDHDLARENVSEIYDMCRYQQAWGVASLSPWCAAFTNIEMKVMEYREDAGYYYYCGPGSYMNARLACPLAKDMIERFSAVEKNPDATHPSALLYFAHETTVEILSAQLGLTHDSLPLRGDNYPQQQNRQFRTSHQVPFAGNVLVVLYNCTGTGLQTVFYQTEFMVPYAFCNEGRCEWSYIKNKFGPIVQDQECTDFSFCRNKGERNVDFGFLLSTLAIVCKFLRLLLR